MVKTKRLIYWTTIFGHRKCSGEVSDKTGVSEGYRNPPGELMGLMGLSGERGATRAGRTPPAPWVGIGLGKGGSAPLSFSLSFLPPLFLVGNLLGIGFLFLVGILLGARPRRVGRPPLAPLYTGTGAP